MGARPSSFKKGGGFLNNVTGVISDYQFTDEFNGVAWKPGKNPKTGKPLFHSLYCVLSVRVDGADEDVTTTLFVGGADDFEVSDDGHGLTPVEDGRELGASSSFAIFITSLCQAGFPDTLLPEDEINFEAIIGTRAHFIQKKDVDATTKLGKRKDKKTGKEYDRQNLEIDTVIDLPGAAEAPAKAGKPGKAGKGKPAPVEDDFDVTDYTEATIKAVLEAKGGTIEKPKLGMAVLGYLMKNKKLTSDQRDEIRNWLTDDDNLDTLVEGDVITFNKKKGQIALVD